MALTPKQERFIKEYLISLNVTDAAIKAGYSEKTASKIGSENLTKPEIIEAIRVEQQKTSDKLDITRENVLEKLLRIQETTELTNPNASLKSIEMICKILGLNAPVKTDLTTNGENINQITWIENKNYEK
jgi:phage terminase small subunit